MTAKSSLFRKLFRSKTRKPQDTQGRNRRMFVEGLEKRIVLDHQGLAVAFIDVDSDDQFTTNDILIAEIIDTNHSGTINAGDTARFGSLPTAERPATCPPWGIGCDDFTPPQWTAPTAFSEGTVTFGLAWDTGDNHRVDTSVSFPGSGRGNFFRFQVFYDTGNPSVNIRERLQYDASGIIDSFDGIAGDQSLHGGSPTLHAFSDIPVHHFIDNGFGAQGDVAKHTNDDFLDIILGGHTPGGGVSNVDPELTVDSATVTVNEGDLATNSGTVTDDDGDTVTLDASAGTVTNNNDGTWSWELATDDGPADGASITIDGDDGNGGTDDVSFTLIVNNVAPDADLSGPSSALVGELVTFTLGADDVSSADQAAGFDFDIDWDGNGTVDQTVSGLDGTTVNHTFTAGGSTTVIVTATDKDGGESDPVSFQINVIQPVDVDVKPGNAQNKVNAKKQGLLTVAIYTTNDFDAANVIGSSVQLAGVNADHFALEDVDNDGDLDLVLHFAVQDLLDALALDLDSGDEESVDVSLTGTTNGGVDILGSDTINFFFPGKGKGKQ